MECNDMSSEECLFSKTVVPNINPKYIHIIQWERQGSLKKNNQLFENETKVDETTEPCFDKTFDLKETKFPMLSPHFQTISENKSSEPCSTQDFGFQTSEKVASNPLRYTQNEKLTTYNHAVAKPLQGHIKPSTLNRKSQSPHFQTTCKLSLDQSCSNKDVHSKIYEKVTTNLINNLQNKKNIPMYSVVKNFQGNVRSSTTDNNETSKRELTSDSVSTCSKETALTNQESIRNAAKLKQNHILLGYSDPHSDSHIVDRDDNVLIKPTVSKDQITIQNNVIRLVVNNGRTSGLPDRKMVLVENIDNQPLKATRNKVLLPSKEHSNEVHGRFQSHKAKETTILPKDNSNLLVNSSKCTTNHFKYCPPVWKNVDSNRSTIESPTSILLEETNTVQMACNNSVANMNLIPLSLNTSVSSKGDTAPLTSTPVKADMSQYRILSSDIHSQLYANTKAANLPNTCLKINQIRTNENIESPVTNPLTILDSREERMKRMRENLRRIQAAKASEHQQFAPYKTKQKPKTTRVHGTVNVPTPKRIKNRRRKSTAPPLGNNVEEREPKSPKTYLEALEPFLKRRKYSAKKAKASLSEQQYQEGMKSSPKKSVSFSSSQQAVPTNTPISINQMDIQSPIDDTQSIIDKLCESLPSDLDSSLLSTVNVNNATSGGHKSVPQQIATVETSDSFDISNSLDMSFDVDEFDSLFN